MGNAVLMTPRLQVVTIDNRPLRDVSIHLDKARIVANENAATMWSLKCELIDAAPAGLPPLALEAWQEYLAPSLTVTYDDGTTHESQMGLYLVLPTAEDHAQEASRRIIDGRDLTYHAAFDAFEETYSIEPGDDPLAKVVAILVTAGIPESRIVVVSKPVPVDAPYAPVVIPAARDWEMGTPKLTIANDILAMVGYYAVTPDNTGRLLLLPYQDLAHATPDVTYASGDGSRVTGDVSLDPPSLSSFANVIMVTAGNPAAPGQVIEEDTENPAIANGRTVRVTATIGLRLRESYGLSAPKILTMAKGTMAKVTGTSQTANGYTWWPLTATIPGVGERSGWSAANWLEVVPGDPDPETDPLRPPIVAIRRNTDPASSVSVPKIGRKVRWERPTDIETQAQADELADRLLQESLGYHQQLKLHTLPDPRRKLREIYAVDIRRPDGTVVASGQWRCTGWEVGMTPDQGVMTHTCSRVEQWAREEVDG